jgi:hypothetical protein
MNARMQGILAILTQAHTGPDLACEHPAILVDLRENHPLKQQLRAGSLLLPPLPNSGRHVSEFSMSQRQEALWLLDLSLLKMNLGQYLAQC